MPVEIENLHTKVHMASSPAGERRSEGARDRVTPATERREDLRPAVLAVVEEELKRLLREIA